MPWKTLEKSGLEPAAFVLKLSFNVLPIYCGTQANPHPLTQPEPENRWKYKKFHFREFISPKRLNTYRTMSKNFFFFLPVYILQGWPDS